MSRTEHDAETPCVEEVDGVPAYDWGGVRPDGRSSTSSPVLLSPVTTIGLSADEDGRALPDQPLFRIEWALFQDTFVGGLVCSAMAQKP